MEKTRNTWKMEVQVPQIGRPLSHRHAREEQARWVGRATELRPQGLEGTGGPLEGYGLKV